MFARFRHLCQGEWCTELHDLIHGNKVVVAVSMNAVTTEVTHRRLMTV